MARAPLLQLSDVSLTFGGNPLFSDVSLVVQPGDRFALVGRNGSAAYRAGLGTDTLGACAGHGAVARLSRAAPEMSSH